MQLHVFEMLRALYKGPFEVECLSHLTKEQILESVCHSSMMSRKKIFSKVLADANLRLFRLKVWKPIE